MDGKKHKIASGCTTCACHRARRSIASVHTERVFDTTRLPICEPVTVVPQRAVRSISKYSSLSSFQPEKECEPIRRHFAYC